MKLQIYQELTVSWLPHILEISGTKLFGQMFTQFVHVVNLYCNTFIERKTAGQNPTPQYLDVYVVHKLFLLPAVHFKPSQSASDEFAKLKIQLSELEKQEDEFRKKEEELKKEERVSAFLLPFQIENTLKMPWQMT